jgi:hypothetical protein
LVAGVPRDKVGLTWRLIAQGTGIDTTMADDGEWIDRGRTVGSDWREAKQNHVKGDRVDRHPTHHSPEADAHDTQRGDLHGNSLSSPYNAGKGNLFPTEP